MNEQSTLVALTELRCRGTRAARELTRFALGQKDEAEAVWQAAQQVIQEGVTGDEAREVVGIARSIIESWFSLVQKARDLWREVAAATGAAPEMLSELGKAEEEASRLRMAVERINAFFNRPKPPIEAARLEKGVQSIAEGRYKTAKEIRSSRRGQEG
jgi:hypothetical protein